MNTMTIQALGTLLAEKGLDTQIVSPDGGASDGTPVYGAACDSRMVEAGNVFVCKGAAFRPGYLASALDAGAVAYLCDRTHAPELAAVAPQVPALVVADADLRDAMAWVSAAAWGHPEARMRVAGITGTKGKTTVAYFVRAILDGDEPLAHAATMGTLETYDGVERGPSRNTTPEAPDLWRHLAHAADSGLDMVMEVSSQGLKYGRVEGLTYDVAAFLNIGMDHVSPIEHPTFEDYLSSKLRIFADARTAVVNADLDPAHAARIMGAAHACRRLVTFGVRAADDAAPTSGASGPRPDVSASGHASFGSCAAPAPCPDVWASDVASEPDGISFLLHTPAWTAPARIGLTGLFNVENAVAAAAIACELGCTQEQVVRGLARCRVPGRMDVISADGGSLVAVVDYAHNGMAVQKALSAVRQSYPDRYLVAVFGATGGKGAERRFEMPPAAAPYADHLVFTEDDAGPEPVGRICAQMVEATPAGTPCEVVLDRAEAIRHAVSIARGTGRPAVVCVLGKGHEARQLRADGPAPMVPDGEFVRQLLGV